MTPEAQRIAIAEACGWTKVEETGPLKSWTGSRTPGLYGYIPDYLNDLNAMHNAECVLSHEKLLGFDRRLHVDACGGDFQKAIHATAAQRAEAFLRAIGKWVD